jgi:hypothetical protein
MKECSFLNGSYIPTLTAYEYHGYIISAWARPEFTNGSTSVGIIYKRGRLGSIIQVQRIEGELFETKELAEQHGVELCKEWIDKQKPETVVLAERTRPTSQPQALPSRSIDSISRTYSRVLESSDAKGSRYLTTSASIGWNTK